MKALTIWQPWATLIALGAKPHEFRKWDFRTRVPDLVGQRIVIHAGARPMRSGEISDLWDRIEDGESSLLAPIALPVLRRIVNHVEPPRALELSAGLCTAVLGKPQTVTELFKDKVSDSSRLDHSMWAWPLTDIQPFAAPIPMRGAQGFWNWPHPEGRA